MVGEERQFRAIALVGITLIGLVAMATPAIGGHTAGEIHVENPSLDNVDEDGRTGNAESTDGDAIYGSVQAGVDAATKGATVRVAPGTYRETVSIDIGITLIGDPGDKAIGPGPNAPVLEGSQQDGAAIEIENGTTDLRIAGFEIRNYGNPSQEFPTSGGILAANNYTRNVTIHDNRLHNISGSAIAATDFEEPVGAHVDWTVRNNHIIKMGKWGVSLLNPADAEVSRNNITGRSHEFGFPGISIGGVNFAVAGAGSTRMGSVTVRDNRLSGSFGTAFGVVSVLVSNTEQPEDVAMGAVTITGNSIDHRAGSGRLTRGILLTASGAAELGTDPFVRDVTISNNTVTGVPEDGVLLTGGFLGSTQIEDVTISSNTIMRTGTGITVRAEGDAMIANVDITRNDLLRIQHQGVRFIGLEAGVISRTLVKANRIVETGEEGVLLRAGNQSEISDLSVRANSVRDAGAGLAVIADGQGAVRDATFSGNDVRQSQYGFDSEAADQGVIRGLTLQGNWLRENAVNGIRLTAGQDAISRSHAILRNQIRNNSDGGVLIQANVVAGTIRIHGNGIVDNGPFGVKNEAETRLDASSNWWGDPTGPFLDDCIGNVDCQPHLSVPTPGSSIIPPDQPAIKALAGSNHRVDFDEVLEAIALFNTNDPVPGTDGETLTFLDLIRIIHFFNSGMPV